MEKENLTNAIVKALAYTENGGAPDLNSPKAGKTGEAKSIFQFLPATWKRYSKEVYGNEDIPITADTETYLVSQKVKKWVDKGYTARQIASMWNAGEAKPNAYKQGWKGTNNGVAYNTPDYANKVLKYSKQFYDEKTSSGPESLNPVISAIKQASNKPEDTLGKVTSSIKQASQVSSPQKPPVIEQPPVTQ